MNSARFFCITSFVSVNQMIHFLMAVKRVATVKDEDSVQKLVLASVAGSAMMKIRRLSEVHAHERSAK